MPSKSLRGSTYRLLPAHDEVTSTSNHLLVRITSVHERQNRPGGLHNLGLFMLRVDIGYARLETNRISTCQRAEDLRLLTMYVSPHPPSSIWCLTRNSHAFLTLGELSYTSPASERDSRANMAA